MLNQPHSLPCFPPELQDKIIGFLYNCMEDLRSCALSSRSLLRPAQLLLFSDISVYHPRNDTDDPLTAEEDCAFTRAAFGRLAGVLSESPHLVSYIRSASVTTYLDAISLLADIGFSRLCYLRLYSDIGGTIRGPVVEPLRRLISLPSLKQVVICADFAAHIFSDCTPHLTELAFDAADEDSGLNVTVLACGPRKTEVKCLILRNSPHTTDWLLDLACPFDCTHLVEVKVIASMSDGVRYLLAAAKQTISTLVLTASDIVDRVELANFSALRHIYLFVPHICYISRLLPSISDLDSTNVLQKITFDLEDSFCDHKWTALAENNLVRFDTAFARLPLPALKEVDVLLAQSDDPDTYSDSEAILRRALRLLEKRQVLNIEVNGG